MNKTKLTSALITLFLSTTSAQAGSEDDGELNVFYGNGAGGSLTSSGRFNSFFGYLTGNNNTTGDGNVFSGYFSGLNNTLGNNNTFIGTQSGVNNSIGSDNAFLGSQAGKSNTSGNFNTFLGNESGYDNTTGNNNTFSGYQAGTNNTIGSANIFTGLQAGFSNTTGSSNTFSGFQVGVFNTTGDRNTISGFQAGRNNATGDGNVFLGSYAGHDETNSNKLYIHNDFNTRTTPLIYGEFDTRLVGINGILGLGTQMPTSTLHVLTDDGSAQILVEETNPSVAARTLFELKNNGNTKFTINNTDAGVAWAFANSGSDLRFSRQGSGVVEFALTNSGNLTIQGNLTELSSRSQKYNIVAMSPAQILSKVLALSISEWSYKDSKEGTRHIGPMAEDFHKAFGLGESAKGIATLDTSGVALAAIQGLKAEKDFQFESLKAEQIILKNNKIQQDKELASLKTQVSELKRLVLQLAKND